MVAPGTPLYTIVEPTTIQLEASVPSESLSTVRVGAAVTFEVRGYPGPGVHRQGGAHQPDGRPATRQVPIWVTVDDRTGRLVSGLFADGRVTHRSEARAGGADRP